MQTRKRWCWAAGLAVLTVLGLSGCGGGNEALPPKASISKVYVMGDSLADVGTFGYKFTVQDASNPKGYPIWPQLVANSYGLDGSAQCNVFAFAGSTFGLNSASGCTNFAIGGARIIAGASNGGASSPMNVGVQMATRASAGSYATTDLVLIDGGGNDAADLVSAYLGASSNPAAFQTFLLQQLDATTLAALLPQANGAAVAAGAYMQALADTFAAQITTQVLNKGASHVVVLNAPDITLTPRFQMVLAGVSAQAGAATASALQGAIRQWLGAFNSKLAANFAGNAKVAVVDFYGDFTSEVNAPASYSLSNATQASCPVTGVDASGLPDYNFLACTSTALNATAGKAADWWKSYAFSDGFHPTPYGHQLMAASVSRVLARAGWL
jgi:outer membrane lipase/esterase